MPTKRSIIPLAFALLSISACISKHTNPTLTVGSITELPKPTLQTTVSINTGGAVQDLSGTVLIANPDSRKSYTASPFGENLTLVSENGDWSGLALSSGGQKVVYWFDGFMFIYDISSQETIQINEERIGSFQYGRMSWSRDAQRVVFDCVPPDRGNSEVCIMELSSGRYEIVTDLSQYGTRPFDGVALGTWNLDSKQIAYILSLFPDDGYSKGLLQIVDIESGNVQTLLDEREQTEYKQLSTAALSPNGRVLLFQAKVEDIPEIFLMVMDTGQLRQVTKSNNKYGTTQPVWNPDGRSFYASTAFVNEENDLVAMPTLFNLEGEILFQMDLGFSAWVVDWQN